MGPFASGTSCKAEGDSEQETNGMCAESHKASKMDEVPCNSTLQGVLMTGVEYVVFQS